jgi:LiaI-LiaF-like transmembrane region
MDERTVVPQRPLKSPGLAGILSVIFPFGAGALYNGQYTKALFHLVMFAGLVHAQRYGGGQPFMGIFLAAFLVYQFFDAIQSAKAINAAAAGQPAGAYGEQGLSESVKSGSIFWGVFLIVLGVVLILANFEIILYSTLADFWPVAVIAVGLKLVLESMAKSKDK